MPEVVGVPRNAIRLATQNGARMPEDVVFGAPAFAAFIPMPPTSSHSLRGTTRMEDWVSDPRVLTLVAINGPARVVLPAMMSAVQGRYSSTTASNGAEPLGVFGGNQSLVELFDRHPTVVVCNDRQIPGAVGGLVDGFVAVERAGQVLTDDDFVGLVFPVVVFEVVPESVAVALIWPVRDDHDGHATVRPAVKR